MDFLNIGAGELLVIGLLGLLLFGPEDLLKVARRVGGYAQKARQMWTDVSTALETDLLLAEQEGEEAEGTPSQGPDARPVPPLPDTEPEKLTTPDALSEEDGYSPEPPDLP